jgi:hypothetical protein
MAIVRLLVMSKDDRPVLQLDDGEHRRLHATWSRSGKHLILTVTTASWEKSVQVELRPDQVERLTEFLSQTVAREAGER